MSSTRMKWAYSLLFLLIAGKFAIYAFVDQDYLIGHTLSDDAFYYLQIAKQSYQTGVFPTFDGKNLTNGFHLLYQLLLLPLVPFFQQSTLAIYAWVITLNVLLFIVGLGLFSRVLRQYFAPWIAWTGTAFTGLATLSTKIVVAGLESSLAFLLAMTFLYVLFVRHGRPWLIGLLLGMLCLSRLDIGLFYGLSFALIGLWQITQGKQTLRDYVLVGVVSLGILTPWVLFNYLLFGHVETISSATKQWVSSQLYAESHQAIYTWLRAAIHYSKGILGNTIGDLVTLPYSLLSGQLPQARQIGAVLETLLEYWSQWALLVFLLLSAAGYLGYYVLYRSENREKAPPWELTVYLVAVPVAHFLLVTTKLLHLGGLWYWLFIPPALAYALAILQRKKRLIGLMASVGLCLIPLTGALTLPLTMLRIGAFQKDYKEIHWYSGPLEVADIVENWQKPAVIGTFNAGMMGYLSSKPVVNLDGLVNNWELLQARQEGTVADYIYSQGITHLVDFGDPWRYLLATGLTRSQVLLIHQSNDTKAFILKIKSPPSPSSSGKRAKRPKK